MAEFNIGDKVIIISDSPLWSEKTGIVKDIGEEGITVSVKFMDSEDETKYILNTFPEEELSLVNIEEELKEDNNMKKIKLTEEELQQWCDDNDANYWTQDITPANTVEIHGINEVLGVYNFDEEMLTLNEAYLWDTPYVEEYDESIPEDEDFIKDYVLYENINGKKSPTWCFLDKIATAENVAEDIIYETAGKFGYKVFVISAKPNFEKTVVAAKGITEKDIYNDYADFLEGKAHVFEVK